MLAAFSMAAASSGVAQRTSRPPIEVLYGAFRGWSAISSLAVPGSQLPRFAREFNPSNEIAMAFVAFGQLRLE
jgi:hypothetical protein